MGFGFLSRWRTTIVGLQTPSVVLVGWWRNTRFALARGTTLAYRSIPDWLPHCGTHQQRAREHGNDTPNNRLRNPHLSPLFCGKRSIKGITANKRDDADFFFFLYVFNVEFCGGMLQWVCMGFIVSFVSIFGGGVTILWECNFILILILFANYVCYITRKCSCYYKPFVVLILTSRRLCMVWILNKTDHTLTN